MLLRGGRESLQSVRALRPVHLATSLRACYAMPANDIAHGAVLLCDGRAVSYHDATSGSEVEHAAVCNAKSGTELEYAAAVSYAMSGTDIADDATASARPRALSVLLVNSAIRLRACYAMPGTDMAHGTVCLHECYATGTD
eukprot:2111125-Rhodomonas_salina.1